MKLHLAARDNTQLSTFLDQQFTDLLHFLSFSLTTQGYSIYRETNKKEMNSSKARTHFV